MVNWQTYPEGKQIPVLGANSDTKQKQISPRTTGCDLFSAVVKRWVYNSTTANEKNLQGNIGLITR